jgi:peptidoglycan/xylan/chitin deacetylase (PgdA/CDA1 family)
MSSRLLVLGWHNVAATPGFPAPAGASERGFGRQMRALARAVNVLALEEALARLYAGERLPARAVCITFDDGYRDNLELAVPVLERLGLPATFFLVPKLLSGEIDAWWETLGWAVGESTRRAVGWRGRELGLESSQARRRVYEELARELKRLDQRERGQAMQTLVDSLAPRGESPRLFMDWAQARRLVARGFSVQSHTCSHYVLANESPESQRAELSDSRAQLESALAISISTLAYPYGGPAEYSGETVAAARESGYSWALTTCEGFTTARTPALEIRRCVIYPERGVLDLLAQLRYLVGERLRGAS